MTMRRGHHTSSVLKAMDVGVAEHPEPNNEPAESFEDAALEPE
jgi:hypothetical protein